MTKQTQAAAKIISNIERTLAASGVGKGAEVIIRDILDEAQRLVNEYEYVWDVALAKACQIHPRTKFCANYIYE